MIAKGHPTRQTAVAVALTLVTITLIHGAAAVAQDECQIPWFVLQNSVGANVMMLCDTSASMNEVIYHRGYNPQVTYSGRFSSTAHVLRRHGR